MDMDNVRIQWPGTKKEPPMSFNIDRFKGRIGIMALLSGGKSLGTDIKLYDGTMTTHSKINKQQSLTQLDINAAKVNLGKIDFIQSLLGAPLQGILDLTVDLNAQTQLSKDGAGIINLSINNTIFGPGNMNLPAGSMVPSLTVPQVSLGVITANFTLDKGLLESKTFTLSGGDFEAELQLTVTLGRIPPLSRLNGKGWFSLKKEFINSNETIKMLFDLIPELRAAKNTNGKVGFSLGGTLGRPMPKLENTPPGPAAQKKPSGPPAA